MTSGIAHAYVRRTKDGVEPHMAAVLFRVPEIDTLTALSERRGATLLPELRRAWVGEQLGFGDADPAKRLPVAAHAYRMAMVAGIQPESADRLLADADGGTPQRFIWVPADDPHAPRSTRRRSRSRGAGGPPGGRPAPAQTGGAW